MITNDNRNVLFYPILREKININMMITRIPRIPTDARDVSYICRKDGIGMSAVFGAVTERSNGTISPIKQAK